MRTTINSVLCLIVGLPLILCSTIAYSEDQCAEFRAMVGSTYNFKPSKLDKTEKEAKSKAMDKMWNAVEAKPKELLPCLRAALEAPQADSWFRFDGSSLLVKLDPSPASKAIQVRSFLDVDLDDADLRTWVQTLSRRAAEGFDVSEAAVHWLNYPKAKYYLPEHGAYEVGPENGALFILGCMDESKALPILLKLVSDQNNKHREFALWMMTKLSYCNQHAIEYYDDFTGIILTLVWKPELVK